MSRTPRTTVLRFTIEASYSSQPFPSWTVVADLPTALPTMTADEQLQSAMSLADALHRLHAGVVLHIHRAQPQIHLADGALD